MFHATQPEKEAKKEFNQRICCPRSVWKVAEKFHISSSFVFGLLFGWLELTF